MPRTTPSEKIQTRAARSRLPQRRKPHWLCLRPGQLHLGYVRRNADQAGHWTVRRYNGGGTYKVARLPGVADDFEAANGATVLSFTQAQDLALRPTPQAQTAAPMLVAQAMADYVDYLQTSGRESAAVTAARAGRLHILPQLGAVPVQALTTEQLRHWLAALANRLAKRNGHEDALRRSRATGNRILGTLRAALNHAYAECRVPSDNTWRGRLKPFRNVAVARKRYLTVPRHSGCSMQRRVACATWCKQHYRPVRVTANSRGSRCMTLMLPAGPWALPSPRLADQGAFSL